MELLRAIRILLIEDCRDHAILFGGSLRKAFKPQHDVDEAPSLTSAFEKVLQDSYDLIFLDLGLPESQGLQTLDTFFETAGSQQPVIVLTATDDDLIGEEALKRGALDFLSKGQFTADQLARTARYGLERWRQRTELEQAQSDLKSFAHAAAHDLKSPVKSIGAYSELLKAILKSDGFNDEAAEYLDIIIDYSDQAERLVNGLLNFSVLGKRSVRVEHIDLAEIAAQATQNVASLIQETSAQITIGQLPPVKADADLLIHVFQNLIGNAIKYRSEATPQLDIFSEANGPEPVICIRDNGIGIDPKNAQSIFEPFKRLTRSEDKDSFGLGLSICQRVIDAHHGRIWVESQPGSGSTFRFTLPPARK